MDRAAQSIDPYFAQKSPWIAQGSCLRDLWILGILLSLHYAGNPSLAQTYITVDRLVTFTNLYNPQTESQTVGVGIVLVGTSRLPGFAREGGRERREGRRGRGGRGGR